MLAKILVEAHSGELAVGLPIAVTVEDEEEYAKFLANPPSLDTKASSPAAAVAAAPTPAKSNVDSVPPSTGSSGTTDVRVSPAARHLIDTHNLNAADIALKSSLHVRGNSVLVRKEDVLRSLSASGSGSPVVVNAAAPSVAPVHIPQVVPTVSTSSGFTDIPNNNIRKVIAKRLSESKQNVPHSYTTMECNIDALLEFRKVLKKEFDINISVNDLIIKSAALALRDVPEANSRWDSAKQVVVAPIRSASGGAQIDISVAVATPTGLITPIVFGADKKGLGEINNLVCQK